MTEAATVRVLEEVEALLDEGQARSLLIAQAQGASADRDAPEAAPLAEAQALVERGNGRLMAIMSALAFQDLTAQKIQRAFEVLEEVNIRLGKIHHLVSFGADAPPPRPRRPRTSRNRPTDSPGRIWPTRSCGDSRGSGRALAASSRNPMLAIIGFAVVTVSVFLGFAIAGGPMLVLLQPAEFLIIGGSAVGSAPDRQHADRHAPDHAAGPRGR